MRQARSAYFPQLAAGYSATHTELSDKTVDTARDAAYQQNVAGVSQMLRFSFGDPLYQVGQISQSWVTARRAREAVDDDVQSYTADITAQWLIFDGFARTFRYLAARHGEKQTEAARAEAQRLLLDAVAQSFHGVQLARENLGIDEADLAYNERLLREAEARKRVGTGSLSDVLNFEVRLRAAKTAVLNDQRDVEVARIALAALMGLADAQLPEAVKIAELASETPGEMTLPEEQAMVAQALERRPDLVQNEYNVKRAEAARKAARGAHFPQVAVFAAHEAQRTDNSRFDEDDASQTFGVNVSLDLFTGGRNRAAVAEARHALTEAERQFEAASIDAVAAVRQALADLRTAQEQLVLQRTTAEYVERNRDLVEKEYNAGQGALARLNQAQRDLVQAQGRLALARVSLRQAWHTLRTETAETLDRLPAEE